MTSDIIFAFVGGIAVGFAAGFGIANRIAGRKYEQKTFQMAKEKIEAVNNLQDIQAKNEDLQDQIERLAAKDKDFAEHISERVGPEDDGPLREPRVISMEEFQFGYPYTEDHSATYYQGNGVLIDENGDVVEDVVGMIGEEGQKACEETTDDTIYIHNDELNINFEVGIIGDDCMACNIEYDDLEED